MKIVCLKSFTILVVISLMINLSNTPTVKAGPLSAAGCILGCISCACSAAKELCLPLGILAGPWGILASAGCFIAVGGGCGACVAGCLGLGATPTP
ncbi:unnamed protein product [Porites evermanni]|uniref:Uncharacterized protein n=1 Tax=Porites evermanni TaxID=104178 RepID=A0ABN8MPK2_9CNID|nr:unnamed protein product [Porites evermanni]